MQPTNTNLSGLNPSQREAVVSDDKRMLVLAGAGSGKTKTLIQKLIYLIEDLGVSPGNILAITFTKNAANEMIDRLIISADSSGEYEEILVNKAIKKKDKDLKRIEYSRKYKWIQNLTVKTFHSLCYNILRNHGVNEFDNKFKIIGDTKSNDEDEFSKYIAHETVFDVLHKLLIQLCEDNEYILKLKRYILDYFVDKVQIDHKQRIDLHQAGKFYTSLSGDKVRSKSEQSIADWLFRHNVKFVYEPLLNVKDFTFKPDFYIEDANLYLEHVSDKSHPMQQKEEQFEKGKLLFVKTFEKMTEDSALFNHTLDSIIKNRPPFRLPS